MLTITDVWRRRSGAAATTTDLFKRKDGHGFVGHWTKVSSSESPTTYVLVLGPTSLHVDANEGQLDFSAPLDGRIVANGNSYTVLSPGHLLEISRRAGVIVGRSDLKLAADGNSFTERHTDAAGSTVLVFFVRQRALR